MRRLWMLGAADPEMQAIEGLLRAAGENVAYAVGSDGKRVHPGNAYQCVAVEGTHWVECSPEKGPPEGSVVIDHHRPGDPGYGRPPEEFLAASSLGQVVVELARLGQLSSVARKWRSTNVDLFRVLKQSGAFRFLPTWEEICRVEPKAEYRARNYVPGWTALKTVTKGREWEKLPLGWYVVKVTYQPGHLSYWDGEDESKRSEGSSYMEAVSLPSELVLIAAADHCLAAAYQGKCRGVDPDQLMRWRAECRAAAPTVEV